VSVHLRVATDIAAPPADCFDLSLDVGQHLASMARSGERVVDGRRSGQLALGEQVTWRARHLGLPWTMTVEIVEHDRPHRFVDEQVSGPFAAFRHVHRFEPTGHGTRMTDEVTFTAPFGFLGRIAERAVLRRRLSTLIVTRNAHLRAELER
jgi:ligand-binding SRPBCC domain-containing protein